LSVLRATDRVLPGMRERGWGRILMITSTAVVEPNPMLAISSTLRSALVGHSKTLASQVAAEGVTVNVLLPGQIETDRTTFLDQASAERSGKSMDVIRAEKCANIPLKRYGSSSEFGAVAAFIASQQASYVTGSMIRVDGGAVRAV
jgi:3-oxoacyl-[acyl-carrier protein] reductase